MAGRSTGTTIRSRRSRPRSTARLWSGSSTSSGSGTPIPPSTPRCAPRRRATEPCECGGNTRTASCRSTSTSTADERTWPMVRSECRSPAGDPDRSYGRGEHPASRALPEASIERPAVEKPAARRVRVGSVGGDPLPVERGRPTAPASPTARGPSSTVRRPGRAGRQSGSRSGVISGYMRIFEESGDHSQWAPAGSSGPVWMTGPVPSVFATEIRCVVVVVVMPVGHSGPVRRNDRLAAPLGARRIRAGG